MNKDEKLEYLKAEVVYLKELHKITYWHYPNKIIYKLSSKYNIEILCNIAKISVSWYYKYKKNVNLKLTKE